MRLIQGDCLEKLKELESNSIDAIVTDPPYELGFMGKEWDNTGIANNVNMWKECLRVLKPGGHLLSFGGTRTYHRMASAIEDAGFEIRDMIEWVYGSGFPKSLNIGKAVDKSQGNERETVREYETYDIRNNALLGKKGAMTVSETKGTSEWGGWGTALKPAHEPICMARKPIEKTVAENVLKWGTGGINIDESRVGTGEDKGVWPITKRRHNDVAWTVEPVETDVTSGRFPANLIHDNSEEVRECFPSPHGAGHKREKIVDSTYNASSYNMSSERQMNRFGDSGNASRFFKSIIYTAKASKSERNKGCEGLEDKDRVDYGGFHSEQGLINNNRNPENRKPTTNNHPTVKPIALMEYLINMVTREGQVVLDPFMGSGSTGVSCINLNRDFIGIELEPDYIKIAEARIKSVPRRLL